MTSSVGRNSVIMASGTAASKITGQIETILLAAAMGTTGYAANAYQAGAMIPQVIFTLVSGGIFNAVLVPQIVRTLKYADAQERINKLVTLAIALLLGITLIMAALTPLLAMLYTSGGGDMLALTTSFTLWCMPQIFFYGLYTVLGQILAAKNRFGLYAWSSVGANIISSSGFIIFIVLFGKANEQPITFWTTPKIALTAGAWTMGVAFQALILFLPLRKVGISFRPQWGLKGIGLRSMGSVAAWSLGIVGINQVCMIFNMRVTSGAPSRAHELLGLSQLVVAGNATYQNAFTLYILPYSLIVVSVATALFPKLSQAIVDRDIRQVGRDLNGSLNTVGLLMFFFTTVFLVIPIPIALALIPSISLNEATLMSGPLMGLALGLPITGAYLIIQRLFYAFEDGLRPFLFIVLQSIIQMTVLGVGVLLLSPVHWATLVAAAVTLGYVPAFPVLLWMVRQRLHWDWKDFRFLVTYAKAAVAAVCSLAVGLLLRSPVYRLLGASLDPGRSAMNWIQAVGSCVLMSLIVLLAYIAVLLLLKTRELLAIPAMFRSRPTRQPRIIRSDNTRVSRPAGSRTEE